MLITVNRNQHKDFSVTRSESARRNTKARERKSKQLVISAITGIYQDEFRRASGKWNIKALADFTHLHRDTVTKHIRIFEDSIKLPEEKVVETNEIIDGENSSNN